MNEAPTVIPIDTIRASLRQKNRGGGLQLICRELGDKGTSVGLTALEDFAYSRSEVMLSLPTLQAVAHELWGYTVEIRDDRLYRIPKPSQPAVPWSDSQQGSLPKPAQLLRK